MPGAEHWRARKIPGESLRGNSTYSVERIPDGARRSSLTVHRDQILRMEIVHIESASGAGVESVLTQDFRLI